MARNTRRSNGMKKLQPAVTTLSFQVPTGESYVDIWLAASIANRRAYKQGFKPAISGMTLYTSNAGVFSTFILPETWAMDNAYVKSKAMWNKMNDQVLDDEPDIQGKYHDFKIAMDANMVAQSVQCQVTPAGKILTPIDEGGNLTSADFTAASAPRADWSYSTIQIPNDPASGVTSEFSLHAVGPNQSIAAGDPVDSKGLITGYAKSRSRPQEQDPNVPLGEGWMNELFDVGENNEEIRDDLADDNDRPPYALIGAASVRETYPGGSEEFPTLQVHDSAIVSATTVGGKTSIRGLMPACGLLKFSNTTGAVATLQIHLVPGTNRGYMCESME